MRFFAFAFQAKNYPQNRIENRLRTGEESALTKFDYTSAKGIDNSRRELHGALLDARILADVYLAMTGGQGALALAEITAADGAAAGGRTVRALVRPAVPLVVIAASEEELAAHEAMLAVIAKASGGRCLWPPSPPLTPEMSRSSA